MNLKIVRCFKLLSVLSILSCGDDTILLDPFIPSYFLSSGLIPVLFPNGWKSSHSINPVSVHSFLFHSSHLSQTWFKKHIPYDLSVQWSNPFQGAKYQVWKGALYYENIPVYEGHVMHYTSSQNHINPSNVLMNFIARNPGDYNLHLPFEHVMESQRGEMSVEEALKILSDKYLFHPAHIHFVGQTWFAEARYLTLSYIFYIKGCGNLSCEAPDWPHQVVMSRVDGRILSFTPHYLQEEPIQGRTTIYPLSRFEGTPTEVPLPHLKSPSRLEGFYWSVKNCRLNQNMSNCTFLTTGENGDFGTVSWQNERYDELNAYYAIGRAYDWHIAVHQKNGQSWSQTPSLDLNPNNPMKVYVRSLTPVRDSFGKERLTYTNGAYMPHGLDPKVDDVPTITLGSGWEEGLDTSKFTESERSLMYMGKFAQSFIHEFNHHVIWVKGVNAINTAETVSVHETFADFLTYLITERNDLASGLLRTQNNEIRPFRKGSLENLERFVFGRKPRLIDVFPNQTSNVYIGAEYMTAALWEIKEKLGTAPDGRPRMETITHFALDFLPANAKYYDIVGAYAIAVGEYGERYKESINDLRLKIFETFETYGLVEGPVSGDSMPAPSFTLSRLSQIQGNTSRSFYDSRLKKDPAPENHTEEETPKKKRFWGLCGQIGSHHSDNGQGLGNQWWLLSLVGILSHIGFFFRRDRRP